VIRSSWILAAAMAVAGPPEPSTAGVHCSISYARRYDLTEDGAPDGWQCTGSATWTFHHSIDVGPFFAAGASPFRYDGPRYLIAVQPSVAGGPSGPFGPDRRVAEVGLAMQTPVSGGMQPIVRMRVGALITDRGDVGYRYTSGDFWRVDEASGVSVDALYGLDMGLQFPRVGGISPSVSASLEVAPGAGGVWPSLGCGLSTS
jgi:hypothetical protein